MNPQNRITSLYDAGASDYEAQDGHAIAADEFSAWMADLSSVFDVLTPPNATALDLGAGTGVFSRFLAKNGFAVTAVEPSAVMLEQARIHPDNTALPPMNCVVGTAEQLQDLSLTGFDLIAARQSACYFADPIVTFADLRSRLNPGGRLLIIEGIWPRAGWSDAALVDALPLACVQTRATLAYMLRCAGFNRIEGDWLHQVNAHHGQTNGAPGSRYFCLASVA
ncbi:MAG: class I SAM-dependent methyltransferase [Burkholderiaceae bacterium]